MLRADLLSVSEPWSCISLKLRTLSERVGDHPQTVFVENDCEGWWNSA